MRSWIKLRVFLNSIPAMSERKSGRDQMVLLQNALNVVAGY